MLIIFIIAFVAFIAVCDFSAFFLDEDLEDILYCTADVQESTMEEPTLEEEVAETVEQPEAVEKASEQTATPSSETLSQILPEDDFEDDFDDFPAQNVPDISPDDFDVDMLGAEDILQKIIEESTVV